MGEPIIDFSEYQVLSAIREKLNWTNYSYLLSEGLFGSYQTQLIFSTISEFHNKSTADLTTVGLKALLYSRVKANEREQYRIAISRIRKGHLKDALIIETVLKRFVKRQQL